VIELAEVEERLALFAEGIAGHYLHHGFHDLEREIPHFT